MCCAARGVAENDAALSEVEAILPTVTLAQADSETKKKKKKKKMEDVHPGTKSAPQDNDIEGDTAVIEFDAVEKTQMKKKKMLVEIGATAVAVSDDAVEEADARDAKTAVETGNVIGKLVSPASLSTSSGKYATPPIIIVIHN